MRKIKLKAAVLGVVVAVAAAAAQAQDTEIITFSTGVAGSYPESIAWNARAGAFMVSSLRGGQIGLVSPSGDYKRFSADRALITSSGIVVDAARNRVLVCNGDVGVSHQSSSATRNRVAQVLEFDLNSGALRHTYDFSRLSDGPIFANDLTIDPQGNIYVTDSFQPQIYKVDQASKKVSVLVRSERLMPAVPAQEVGTKPYLNGIVYHPDGFLIAADYTRGLLWKIPLQSPQTLTEIRLPQRLKGPDGLRLKSATELVAVQSFADGQGMSGDVTLLTSRDGWNSARIAAVAASPNLDGPTSAVLKDGNVWVLNARFPRLFADPASADKTQQFSIVKVNFGRGRQAGDAATPHDTADSR